MVGGAFALARFDVDRARAAFFSERRREQDVVDAKAPAALEGVQAVVPPGELLFGLLEKAEGVGHASCDHVAERGALGLGEVDLAFPALGVVDVARLGGDVEDRRGWRGGVLPSLRPSHFVSAAYQRSLYAYLSVPGASPFGA